MARIPLPPYDEDVMLTICSEIAEGTTVRTACEQNGVSPAILYRWMRRHPDARLHYDDAMETRVEVLFGDLQDIADDGRNDWMTNKKGDLIPNSENVSRSKLRIDTLKFIIGRVAPQKYGSQQNIVLNANVDHKTVAKLDDLDPETKTNLRDILRAMTKKAG